MDVLILAAHPDDETLGCGATIARLASEGCYIKLLTFTDGIGSRGAGGDRRPQVNDAVRILGIQDFVCGNFADNGMDTIPLLDVCKFIESSVDFSPGLIFTHHPECLNVDHRKIFEATCTVFRPQWGNKQTIYSYEVASSTDYNPVKSILSTVYFDVKQEFVDIKLHALEAYTDEMRDYPHTRSIEGVVNTMKRCGNEVGLEYSEKFCHIRSIM